MRLAPRLIWIWSLHKERRFNLVLILSDWAFAWMHMSGCGSLSPSNIQAIMPNLAPQLWGISFLSLIDEKLAGQFELSYIPVCKSRLTFFFFFPLIYFPELWEWKLDVQCVGVHARTHRERYSQFSDGTFWLKTPSASNEGARSSRKHR